MIKSKKSIPAQQAANILDGTRDAEIDVIVQMEPDRKTSEKLRRAAGETLARRRLSLSPRELLPGAYQKRMKPRAREETASTLALMGQATAKALGFAVIRQMGLGPLVTLIQSDLVKTALGRITVPKKKSTSELPPPPRVLDLSIHAAPPQPG